MLGTIVGVEVSKTSVLCCPIEDIPEDPASFARSYEPVLIQSNIEGVAQLLALGDIYVIEPTGDYSRLWIDTLRANGKTVLRVNPNRVQSLKQYSGIASKTDRYDGAFLAIYGAMNRSRPEAFLNDYAEDLRHATLQHQFLSKATGNLQRRLWQLLSHEWPEACKTRNGTKPQQNRLWMDDAPPALWRFISDEKVLNQKSRKEQLDSTIGTGLSDLSKVLAAQICELERQQYPIEQKIAALLEASEFGPYHAVFGNFGFGELTRAVILSRVYPFGRFLGPDGKPLREKRPSSKTEGRFNRRDRSLGAFRLALGNGTKVYQSGQTDKRRAAGSSVARSTLFLHVHAKIVMSGRRLGAPEMLRRHVDFYDGLGKMPYNLRVSKVIGRIVKDLYRELLAL